MSAETVTPDVVGPEQKQMLTIVEQNALSADTAKSLQESFAPMFKNARSILEQSKRINVTDASQTLEIKLARECRLALKNVRVESDKTRKALKEDSLRRGRAIDGFHAILLELTETEEKRLREMEEIVQRAEAARVAKLKADREAALKPYGIDTAFYSLGEMTDTAFAQLLENTQAAHQAKLERERRAEEERIRQENERLKEEQRIREENARLRKEAQEREAAAKAERERLEAIAAEERRKAAAAAEQARKEKEEAERVAKAERDRLEMENREKLRIEREAAAKRQRDLEEQAKAERAERERLEREQQERQAAEERRRQEEQEAKEAAAAAPDAEKLRAYAANLGGLSRPTFQSRKGKLVGLAIEDKLAEFIQYLESETAALEPKKRPAK